MAQKYRKIDPRIWTDERFTRLAAEGKLLALWMLSSGRVNRCGILLWSPGLAGEETGIPGHRVEGVCREVCDTLRWTRDPASKTVFLGRWWRYNRPDNASALKGALSDLHDVPANALRPALERAKDDLPAHLREVYQTVLDTVYDTVSPQEQEQEQEQEQDREQEQEQEDQPAAQVGVPHGGTAPTDGRPRRGGRAAKPFTPPTVEEVAAYCRERNNVIDPERFVDHYTANGWMVGKSKMKDWRAAVRTWEKNDRDRPTGKPRGESLTERASASFREFLGQGEGEPGGPD